MTKGFFELEGRPKFEPKMRRNYGEELFWVAVSSFQGERSESRCRAPESQRPMTKRLMPLGNRRKSGWRFSGCKVQRGLWILGERLEDFFLLLLPLRTEETEETFPEMLLLLPGLGDFG